MFTELSTDLQTILQFMFKYVGNTFFLLYILGFSGFYLFYWKPNFEKKTSLLMVGIPRIFFSIFSCFSLFLTPFALLLNNPSVDNPAFVSFYQIYYFTFITLWLWLAAADFIRFMPTYIMSLAGFDTSDPEIQKVNKEINKEAKKLPFIGGLFNGRRK